MKGLNRKCFLLVSQRGPLNPESWIEKWKKTDKPIKKSTQIHSKHCWEKSVAPRQTVKMEGRKMLARDEE